MIAVYFHDFASWSEAPESRYFKDCGELFCVHYDSSKRYLENKRSLLGQIQKRFGVDNLTIEDTVFVGFGLGGFYAKQLAESIKVNSVLINPFVYPAEDLKQFKGLNHNHLTNESFTLSQDVIDSYAYEKGVTVYDTPCRVFASSLDEQLPHNVADCRREYARYSGLTVTNCPHAISEENAAQYKNAVVDICNTLVFY